MSPLNEKDCVTNAINNNPTMTDEEITAKYNVALRAIKRIRSGHRKMQNELPELERANVKALLKGGLSPEEISDRHGYPLDKIYRICNRMPPYPPKNVYLNNGKTRATSWGELPLMQPPDYIENQICKIIETKDLKDLEKEIMWAYLIKLKYEKNVSDLVKILCGQEEKLPENPQIGIETRLYPDQNCIADMAVGFIEKVRRTFN